MKNDIKAKSRIRRDGRRKTQCILYFRVIIETKVIEEVLRDQGAKKHLKGYREILITLSFDPGGSHSRHKEINVTDLKC